MNEFTKLLALIYARSENTKPETPILFVYPPNPTYFLKLIPLSFHLSFLVSVGAA